MTNDDTFDTRQICIDIHPYIYIYIALPGYGIDKHTLTRVTDSVHTDIAGLIPPPGGGGDHGISISG